MLRTLSFAALAFMTFGTLCVSRNPEFVEEERINKNLKNFHDAGNYSIGSDEDISFNNFKYQMTVSEGLRSV
jgi:ribosomal protein L5